MVCWWYISYLYFSVIVFLLFGVWYFVFVKIYLVLGPYICISYLFPFFGIWYFVIVKIYLVLGPTRMGPGQQAREIYLSVIVIWNKWTKTNVKMRPKWKGEDFTMSCEPKTLKDQMSLRCNIVVKIIQRPSNYCYIFYPHHHAW